MFVLFKTYHFNKTGIGNVQYYFGAQPSVDSLSECQSSSKEHCSNKSSDFYLTYFGIVTCQVQPNYWSKFENPKDCSQAKSLVSD